MGIRKIGYILLLSLFAISCANRGVGPQGGPKDSIPPVPLHSEPELGALNFRGKRIEVTFNEYIQLSDIASNLMMSPPQQTPPDVKARGKKLMIQFQDTLQDSTTYTLDFGSAVCDYHEKVPLHGFSFYFSTGDEIDTLLTRGRVYEAENLNPVYGITVGIHRDLDDSAFVSKPFARIAKTDSTGRFRIGNIHPGTYRIYAINDISRDYRLTVGEALAFTDTLLTVVPDDSLASDETSLLLFKEAQQKLYLQRTLREQRHRIQVLFSAPPDSMPAFRPLCDSLNYYISYSNHKDTVTVWLTDSFSIQQDSLFFESRYRRTDSLFRMEWCVDTLRAIWRAPKLSAKALENEARENRNRRLDLRSNARKDFELFDTIYIACSTPIQSIDSAAIHLYERIDTLTKPIPFAFVPTDTLPMKLLFSAALEPSANYELRLDSGALHDVYGTTHIAGTYSLKMKSLSDYSTLLVRLVPFEPQARLQLLNGKDEVLRELPAKEEGTLFEYLKPDTYYLRLYIDANEDGKWTTGSWELKRQPEAVYYYPNSIQTKSNWDFEEEWDYRAVPQLESKPKALIKLSSTKKK